MNQGLSDVRRESIKCRCFNKRGRGAFLAPVLSAAVFVNITIERCNILFLEDHSSTNFYKCMGHMPFVPTLAI